LSVEACFWWVPPPRGLLEKITFLIPPLPPMVDGFSANSSFWNFDLIVFRWGKTSAAFQRTITEFVAGET
jgi:hypothetical protein